MDIQNGPITSESKSKKHYRENKQYYADKLKEWRAKNPEKYKKFRELEVQKHRNKSDKDEKFRLEHNRKSRERYHNSKRKDPVRYLLRAAKARASKTGKEFNLDRSDIFIPEVCPVLGIALEQHDNQAQNNSVTLDRIDCSKGYVKGNVQVLSRKANAMKLDASREELLLFAKWIYDRYKDNAVAVDQA